MNKISFVSASLAASLCLASAASAAPFIIDDDTFSPVAYYGGLLSSSNPFPPTPANDLVDGSTDFSVTALVANQAAGVTTVSLFGPYFNTGHADGTIASGAPGDLYISSTGYRVNQPADHARLDTFDLNEGWDFVVSFLDQKVYALNFATIVFSNSEGGIWPTFRALQAYRGGYGAVVSNATVTLDPVLKSLTFEFPDLGDVDELGYHWTQACGNDVVEGGTEAPPNQEIPVPEPTSLLLMGTGLAVAGLRKRARR